MEAPPAFRSRRPPKSEVYTKLCVLIAFCVFCAAVGLRVKDMPLPAGRHSSGGAPPVTEEPDMFTFPALSPEKAMIAQLSARIPVPYLVPWGADERPAMFFMWHLLYRSLKPDLNQLAARLLPDKTTTDAPVPPPNTSAMPAGRDAVRTPAELKVAIQVLETQDGYITTSLAHYLPHAYVFSVVTNASTEGHASGHRRGSHGRRRSRGPPPEALLAERRGYSEAVAAKVERVLASPQAEKVGEASHQPGMNGVLPTLEPTTAPAADGGDATRTPAPVEATPDDTNALNALTVTSPRLFLCVPHSGLNASYVSAAAAKGLRVHYQVVLFPYVVLHGASTPLLFDAALRALLLQADVATFIVLPSLADSDTAATPEGNETSTGAPAASPQQQQAHHAAAFHAQELNDYNAWYAGKETTPMLVLQRALGIPDITEKYHVSIAALGSKRWAGALRQLCRVELRQKTQKAMARAETATDAALNISSAVTTAPASTPFGCLTRQRLLSCTARPLHTTCEGFADARFS